MELVGRRATELAEMVRDGQVTARQVVDEHLAHLDLVEPRLGAFTDVCRAAARREADDLDARHDRAGLALAGVPVAIKDVADVAGLSTRHGSRALRDVPAAHDDELVANLRAAGAIVLGKTRCPELSLWGTSDDAEATTVGPWDPSRTAGGSSGGSAAAVAAGVVPIALASDGLGSVRIPAAANGLVGIKPGADLLPVRVDGRHHWFGMSRYGPLATTVADLAITLDVMNGVTEHREPAIGPHPLRVGVSWRPATTGVPVARAWQEAAVEAGRVLGHLGHELSHVDPPYDPALTAHVIARWTQGAADDVAHLGADIDRLQPRTRAHAAAGERLAALAPVTDRQADRWRERVAPMLESHDVLITPTLARTPPNAVAWHQRSWVANLAVNATAYPFCPPWNLADVPAAAVPLGQHRGRPLSVQIVARQGREGLVLAVAHELERTVGWRRHAPGWGVIAPS